MLGLESVNDLPESSLEAAQIIVAASGNLNSYLNKPVKLDPHVPQASMESLYHGSIGSLSVDPSQVRVSLESFEELKLEEYLNYSILYNVMASRQDPLNEMFFKPLTITADEIGYITSVRVEEVWDGVTHNPDGNVQRVIKQKLIDALVHPEILETNSTEIIPYVQSGGSIDNTSHFVDAKDVAPYDRLLENVPVKTAPLKIAEEHGILGLSSHPTLIANGLMNEKDSLDGAVKVRAIYLKINNKVVKYNTDLLHKSGFFKSREGDMNEMSLNFGNKAFVAGTVTKAIDGSDIPEFKALTDAGYDARLHIRMNGVLRRDLGTVEISAPKVRGGR